LAYYACFLLGVTAHLCDGLGPDRGTQYSHGGMWRTIDRWMEKLGRVDLRGGTQQLYGIRIESQYRERMHSPDEARRTMDLARQVVETLQPALKQLISQ
jgi:hypothetical protein